MWGLWEITGRPTAPGVCVSKLGLFQAEEEDYSEEESAKVELKQDSNGSCESAAKAEKGDEKPDSKGAVTGERQSGDGQVGVIHELSALGRASRSGTAAVLGAV